jgi:hypothetical protein
MDFSINPYESDLDKANTLHTGLLSIITGMEGVINQFAREVEHDSHMKKCLNMLKGHLNDLRDGVSDDLEHGILYLLKCKLDNYDPARAQAEAMHYSMCESHLNEQLGK